MDDFQQAHEEFLRQLSDEERTQFTQIRSSQIFLDEFKKLGQFAKKHTKWTKLLRSVEKCSEKLDPYFDVVGITIQSHPEWAAIAWGAFRLVLLLASNYGTFFDKLAGLLEQLSARLPLYASLVPTLKESKAGAEITQGFQASLRAVYGDLFEIFRGIARVFTQKSGKLRKTPIVIGELLWQPFDVRFANILRRFDAHCEILKSEVDFLHIKMSGSMLRSQVEEKSRNENQQAKLTEHRKLVSQMKQQLSDSEKQFLIERIRAWIQPTPFVEVFKRLSAVREEGTAEWIFQEEEYKRWLLKDVDENLIQPMERFLWVRGNPGTGKSVLATSVIQELMAISTASQVPPPLVTFFFFEYNANDGCPAPRGFAYRAILSQLLTQFQDDKDILEILSFALLQRRHGQLIATTDELVDLLRMLASHITCWYLVIDGVDECEDSDNLLLELSNALGDQPTKILLLSRPNVRFLRRKMQQLQILTVSRLLNEADLRIYFDTHLELLQDLDIIPNHASRPLLVEHLLTGADGMFQWAMLMIAHLQSDGLMPRERLDVITKLKSPERLEDMYIRILWSLAKKLFSEQSLARRLFLWLTFAKRTIRANQLQDILSQQREESSEQPTEIRCRAKEDGFVDFEHSAVMVSGSLVEKRLEPFSETTIYSFTHRSVLEFFKSRCEDPSATYGSKAGTMDYFLPGAYEAEAELTLACLSYIFQRVPGKPLSGNMFEAASRESLCDSLPFVGYAAQCWPRHLMSTRAPLKTMRAHNLDMIRQSMEAIFAILRRFLLSRLLPMVWVELKYTFETRSSSHEELHDALLQWSEWARELNMSALPSDDVEIPSAVAAFAGDLTRLHELWGDTLLVGPHQIWNDVTAFTSSPFFVTTAAVNIKFLASESFNRAGLSTTPLSKISRDDPSTDFLAILTIWPSRSFEMQCRNANTRHRKRKAPTNDVFEGWIAQYEIWNITYEDPITVETSRISLESTEVHIQYERFRKYVQGSGKPISTQTAGKELALHFPSSIDSDLNTFTVLRTVFKRRQSVPLGLHPISTDASEERWRSIPMPIMHTIHATLLYGLPTSTEPKTTGAIPETEPVVSSRPQALRLSKTPAFRLTVFRDYVLYQSLDGREALGENEDTAGTIAIYLLTTLPGGCDDVRLLGCIKGESICGSISHCVFHPEYPLLAFHYQSTIGGPRLFLWCFTKGDSSNTHSSVVLGHEVLQPGSKCDVSTSVATAGGRVKHLQFSALGTELSYQLYNSSYHNREYIGGCFVYDLARRQAEIGRSNSQILSQSLMKVSPQRLAMERTNVLPHSMTLGQEVRHMNGTTTSLSFDVGASNRSVKLVHRESGVEKEQSLLSLPAWEDIKNVSVSIRTPSRSREDKVTIILNKTAKPFYTLRNGDHLTAPAVVKKDVRAIMPLKRASSSKLGGDKLSAGWGGICFCPENFAEDGGPSQKKASISDV
ncbi:hypothetical protein FPRO05_02216 [Fusarium proliferatum]|uniref:NACHT domain-containing protein n=1 Tax=Gibberella intermedia TaxID=948311 RepID=A0A365MYA4_GIBIN|nr:hypothetical protein FPRO05_02216 [Fusarium proliferatum]